MDENVDLIFQGVLHGAALMEVAARTAPKSKGEDFIEVKTLTGKILQTLGDAMIEFGKAKNKKNFDRDGINIKASQAVVLIGINNATTLGLDCGACGLIDCSALEKAPKNEGEYLGPQCAFRIVDLGIAVGSAVKTAQALNIDNRVMYRAAVVARSIGIIDWDYALGIPLSATGKNIYFDR